MNQSKKITELTPTKQLETLIIRAGFLSQEMDQVLFSRNDFDTEKIFSKYEIWKIDSIQLLQKLQSSELYIFSLSDGVGGLSNLLIENEENTPYINEMRPKYQGEDSNYIGVVSTYQMESAKSGLEKRTQALVNVLRDLKNKKTEKFNVNNSEYWIIKNGDEYYFDNKPVKIKNKEADYIIIFDTVASQLPNGGQISYEDIKKVCKKKGLKSIERKNIQRALCGESSNFFQHIKDVKHTPSLSLPLFESSQKGDKLIFNNKRK